MKKRLKADNVGQLLEIVQAVQRGEDTETIAARRAEQKKQEALEAARAEKLERERRKKRRDNLIGKFLGKKEAWEDDDSEDGAKESGETQEKPKESAPAETAEAEAVSVSGRRPASAYERWREEEEQTEEAESDGKPEREAERQEEKTGRDEADDAEEADDEEDWDDADDGDEADDEPEKPAGPSAAQRIQSGLRSFGAFLKRALSEEEEDRGGEPDREKKTAEPGEPWSSEDGGDALKPEKPGRAERASESEETEDALKPEKPGREEKVSESEETEDALKPEKPGRAERASEPEPLRAGRVRRSYRRSVSEEAEAVGRRILRGLHMEPASEAGKADGTASGHQGEALEGSLDPETERTLDRIIRRMEEEGKTGTAASGKKETEKAGTAASGEEEGGKTGAAASTVLEEQREENTGPETETGTIRRPRLSDQKAPEGSFTLPEPVREIRVWFRKNLQDLAEKGIGRRELAMLGIGAILAVLLLVLIGNGIGGMISTHRKQKNVTADDGLTVTVEEQPDDWCSEAEVKLRFLVKSGSAAAVRINGETVQLDEQGYVTVTAQEVLLNAEVELAEGGSLTAQIELPYLDTEPPAVTAVRDGVSVTLTAEDDRSGVGTIRYAAVQEGADLQLPLYGDYTDPLTVESGYVYYFYAQDRAGNRSAVTVTTFEAAESLTTGEESLSLFPGETASAAAKVSPEGALLSGLTYESSNPDVATVDDSGLVTAVAAGSAVIRIGAEGVETVTCEVDVSESRTVTVSAIGDCTLGTDEYFNTSTNFNAYYSVNGASWFFQNVREILENDDVTFANFEGTLTTETARESKEYAFKGDPSYTEILQDGSVEVVTLANNHSSDYGAQSLADTEQYLTEAEISWCKGDTIALREVNGIQTAFIGIYELADGLNCETQVRTTIADAKEQGAQLIILAFHWGSESSNTPDETQISLAHTAIDCGADLVVGHHPHVLQGIEKYNGKYIVYSLGNFCFGGNSSPSDTDTMIFRQTFTVRADGAEEDDAIEIIPCSVTSASGYNNYQPTPATGTEAERILSRINEYSAAFGDITYTASTGLA